MSTSFIGTTLDSIRAGLVNLSGLSGVNVFSGSVPMEEAGLECAAFGNGRLNEESMSMGGNRLEVWTIGGEIRVVKGWQGTTEATIKAARDRALEIAAEIESYLNDTYTGPLPYVEMTTGEIEGTFNPDGRVCSLGFEFTVKAAKNP
jgi:hypothetical protein